MEYINLYSLTLGIVLLSFTIVYLPILYPIYKGDRNWADVHIDSLEKLAMARHDIVDIYPIGEDEKEANDGELVRELQLVGFIRESFDSLSKNKRIPEHLYATQFFNKHIHENANMRNELKTRDCMDGIEALLFEYESFFLLDSAYIEITRKTSQLRKIAIKCCKNIG